jgi:hypothetical protein
MAPCLLPNNHSVWWTATNGAEYVSQPSTYPAHCVRRCHRWDVPFLLNLHALQRTRMRWQCMASQRTSEFASEEAQERATSARSDYRWSTSHSQTHLSPSPSSWKRDGPVTNRLVVCTPHKDCTVQCYERAHPNAGHCANVAHRNSEESFSARRSPALRELAAWLGGPERDEAHHRGRALS